MDAKNYSTAAYCLEYHQTVLLRCSHSADVAILPGCSRAKIVRVSSAEPFP